jgi:hypothetical protein
MELLGLLFLVFIIIAHFVEGFALVNMVQFFRGKKTPLEKIAEKYQASKHNKNLKRDC